MIHSAKPSPVANIVFKWKLFSFARCWNGLTDARTDNMCENKDHYLWDGRVDQENQLSNH